MPTISLRHFNCVCNEPGTAIANNALCPCVQVDGWRQPRLNPPTDLQDESIALMFGTLTFAGEVTRSVLVHAFSARLDDDTRAPALCDVAISDDNEIVVVDRDNRTVNIISMFSPFSTISMCRDGQYFSQLVFLPLCFPSSLFRSTSAPSPRNFQSQRFRRDVVVFSPETVAKPLKSFVFRKVSIGCIYAHNSRCLHFRCLPSWSSILPISTSSFRLNLICYHLSFYGLTFRNIMV